MDSITKKCSKCGKIQAPQKFYKDKSRKDSLSPWCKQCVAAYNAGRPKRPKKHYASSPRQQREYQLRHMYGIAGGDYDAMLAAQGGKCAICQTDTPGRYNRFQVDHDHSTGRVRGLLCGNCNRGIGNLRDSPDLLRAASRYIAGVVE
jgi:hypothetical protein